MIKEEVTGTNWNSILLGEILLFRLLGRLVYEPLSKEWLENLIDEDVFDDVPFSEDQRETALGLELLKKWSDNNKKELTDASFDDLRADNFRLFVGVNLVLAPLWESVHFTESRLVFQERTLQVRDWYRRFGLEPEKLHKEPDDHIGLEMIFISHLAGLALQAFENQDDEKFGKLIEAQRQFLSEHLLEWGPEWCFQVLEHTKTDFYLGIGHLILGALHEIAGKHDIQLKVTR